MLLLAIHKNGSQCAQNVSNTQHERQPALAQNADFMQKSVCSETYVNTQAIKTMHA